jgi:hypothetical protein
VASWKGEQQSSPGEMRIFYRLRSLNLVACTEPDRSMEPYRKCCEDRKSVCCRFWRSSSRGHPRCATRPTIFRVCTVMSRTAPQTWPPNARKERELALSAGSMGLFPDGSVRPQRASLQNRNRLTRPRGGVSGAASTGPREVESRSILLFFIAPCARRNECMGARRRLVGVLTTRRALFGARRRRQRLPGRGADPGGASARDQPRCFSRKVNVSFQHCCAFLRHTKA